MVKSIIDIEVKDSAVKELLKIIETFKAKVDDLPKGWGAVDDAVTLTGASFAGMVVALTEQADTIDRQNKALQEQEKREKNLLGFERSRLGVAKDIWKTTVKTAETIAGATRDILKWTGIGTALSALTGAGSLWGLDKLAAGVSNDRRTSTGLGLSIGQYRSANLNLQRFLDVPSVLSNINEAENSFQGRNTLHNILGATGNNPLEEMESLMRRSVSMFKAGTLVAEGPWMQALQSMGISIADVKRMAAHPGEMEKAFGQTQADVGKLNLDDETARKWQDFIIQIERAGLAIENSFVKWLTPLDKPLGELSRALENFLEAFFKSPQLNKWIVDLSDNIEVWAKQMEDPKFQKSVQDFINKMIDLVPKISAFADKIAQVTDGLYNLLKYLHVIPSDNPRPQIPDPDHPGQTVPDNWTSDDVVWGNKGAPNIHWGDFMKGLGKMTAGGFFANLEGAAGLPANLLSSLWTQESGKGANMLNKKSGAAGHFQFMGPTASQYGVTNPYDLGQSATGAAHYMEDLLKEFKGDLSEALAGYNWGQGNVERDIKQHGAAWKQYLPDETKKYIKSVLGRLDVNVYNHTGLSVSAQASVVAQ